MLTIMFICLSCVILNSSIIYSVLVLYTGQIISQSYEQGLI